MLARQMLAADGFFNGNKLVVLCLTPYRPMLNTIEGRWSVLKASLKKRLVKINQEFLIRDDCNVLKLVGQKST